MGKQVLDVVAPHTRHGVLGKSIGGELERTHPHVLATWLQAVGCWKLFKGLEEKTLRKL